MTKRRDLSERALGALLLAPAAALLLIIVVYPIATLFWNSLHSVDNANPAAGETFVALANYARAFDDERFWHSAPMREALGDPEFTVDDGTLVVAEVFRVVED